MGRPALLGRRPRGPQYRGVRRPPHYGNPPWKRKNKHNVRHRTKTPKDWARHLAGPHGPNTTPITKHKDGNHNIADNNPTKQFIDARMRQTSSQLEDSCPGGPRGGGQAQVPPRSLVSEIAAISGVRDWHRNRKSQKSFRFRCSKI